MFNIAASGLLVLAVLVFAGGAFGFVKAKSKASIIAGSISALALSICYYTTVINPFGGVLLGIIVAALLEIIFVVRLFKTRKFMPSGLMLILCFIEQLLLAFALFGAIHH